MSALLLLSLRCILPESPRWLVLDGRIEEACSVLSKVYPLDFNVNVLIHDIQRAAERAYVVDPNSAVDGEK